MKTEGFLQEVQARSGLSLKEHVARVVDAVLETLGERLGKPERENPAAQLPEPLREAVLRRQTTDRYRLEEFYNRVSSLGNLGYPEAVNASRATVAVLREAVSQGEIEDVLTQLSDPYRELFGAEPESALSPTRT